MRGWRAKAEGVQKEKLGWMRMDISEGASEWRLMRWGVTAGKRGALFFFFLLSAND